MLVAFEGTCAGGQLQVRVVDAPTTTRCDDAGCVLELSAEQSWGTLQQAVATECLDVLPTSIVVGRAAGLTLGLEPFGEGELLTDPDVQSALMYWVPPCSEDVTAGAHDLERLGYQQLLPTLSVPGRTIALEEGETLALSVVGSPLHSVAWYGNSELLGTSEDMLLGPLHGQDLELRVETTYEHALCGALDTELETRLVQRDPTAETTDTGQGQERGCSTVPGGGGVVLGGLLVFWRRTRRHPGCAAGRGGTPTLWR